MLDLPTIRIEIEGMKYQILHAFSSSNQEIEAAVAKQLEAVIANYPFEQEIRQMSYDILHQAIKRSMERFFWSEEGAKLMDEVVDESLKNVMKKMRKGG